MKTLLTAAATLSLLLAPLAEASPKNGRGNGNGNGNGNGAWANGEHCPPGLAGRTPACTPPGQAGRGGDGTRRADSDGREEAEDRAEEVIRVADEDDRDSREALAIVGTLAALALIERARRNAEPEATVAPTPVAPMPVAPAPSFFSLSEVPSRPSSLQALATAPYIGDATDPESFTGTPEPATFADAAELDSFSAPAEPVAAATPQPVAPTTDRLVPLRSLPDPVPTPEEEETLLSDVFRRAAEDGATGF